MALPNSSFSDIITTTLQGYSGELADNITNHNAFFRQINRKGNKTPATGRSIVQEIEYAQNSTVAYYSGAEILDISPTDTYTAAEFPYKQLAGNVVITGLEQIQNSGKEAVHNLLKSRMRTLEKSLENTIATSLYADGTGSGTIVFKSCAQGRDPRHHLRPLRPRCSTSRRAHLISRKSR